MNALPLLGIPGSNPLGAMSAFGLFRVLSYEQPFGAVRLSWKFEGDWRPVLVSDALLDLDGLIQFLIDRQAQRCEADYLTWGDIKYSPRDFREKFAGLRLAFEQEGCLHDIRETAEFYTAFGSECVTAKSTPDVKPTAFHMTAGQQRFLKSASEVANTLNPNQRTSRRQTAEARREEITDAFKNALAGPWGYIDSNHALGWDPTTEGLYALSDISPSAAGPRSVRAAIWLAFESLPLFPAVPRYRKLHTTGFDLDDETFTWPIWEPPISLDSLRCLLGSHELTGERPQIDKLRHRGVKAILRTKCVRDANGRGTFRNPVEIPC